MVDLILGPAWVPPPQCPVCSIILGSNPKVFEDHFYSWHQLTTCAMVLARNMFLGPAACEETTQVLRDFEKDRRMMRDMKTNCDDTEQKLLHLLDLLKMDNCSGQESKNAIFMSELPGQSSSSLIEQLALAIKRREAEIELLVLHKGKGGPEPAKLPPINEDREETNLLNLKDVEKLTLSEKVSNLESNLHHQVLAKASQQRENYNLRRDLIIVETKLIKMEKELLKSEEEKNCLNTIVDKLFKDNEDLKRRKDALHVQSERLKQLLDKTLINTLSITEETGNLINIIELKTFDSNSHLVEEDERNYDDITLRDKVF